MKSSARVRVILLAAAMVLVVAATVAVGYGTWRRTILLQDQYETLHGESFLSAIEFKALFREAYFQLMRFELLHQTQDRVEFLRRSDELSRWLAERQTQAGSIEVKSILGDMRRAYSNYLADARQLVEGGAGGNAATSEALLARLEEDATALARLDTRLANLQQEALTGLFTRTRQDLAWFEHVLLVALAALLVWIFATGVVVFRRLVMPLRRQVVEQQLIIERKEKLSSLGVMAAGLAHEIRNPLTAIKARLFSQQRRLASNAAAIEDNRLISQEISRLEHLVKEVLQFARPAEPAFQPVSVDNLLERIGTLFQPELQKSGIRIEIASHPTPQVRADPDQLQQALVNLVRNAAESIGSNGTVSLRARLVTQRKGLTPLPRVAIEIADTGKGIPADAQARLFDPFFTTKPNGTGLGLSITARIVERHGGRIEFQSEPGRGALFRILLPPETVPPGV